MLFEVGEKEKALEVANTIGTRVEDMAGYMIANGMIDRDLYNNIAVMGELQRVLYKYGEAELAKKYEDAYERFANQLPGQ
jgi:hypothetical protein